ncbi:putative 16S rRNA (cytosine(967)-C(5))-methyltransferase [Helianthus annuus]|uniref:16S rRNA (Cytosine(967)-C(5))-methyltransferase n=1 Tax=Helianthus annuus TaxID=4232 RepID=A0A251TNY6_HELAN|nr:28S rRNA (cytosine-C(5))-methyltransferase isoform X2 [Helianthus annuus]KAF5787744.1 putative 16S rRNA (cytosine(967)-C(5))-methyltransferase [Helianthus annuus]
MVHKKPAQPTKPAAKSRRESNVERSAYFARREAAKVLKSVLQGDANRRAVGSIKTLVYSPTIRNKKATFALVCQTLKYLPIIKDVMEIANVLNSKWKRQAELMYIITYDILFGQDASLTGDPEKYLILRKGPLQSALAKILVKKGAKRIEDLMAQYQIYDVKKPRYVRVNTLKMDVETAMFELGKENVVQKDDMIPDLLVLPPSTDLHSHPLVTDGSVFMQGKASSMVAVALGPKPGWEVIDACAAPGNKTVHVAALMKGEGKIVACELNKDRVKRLEHTAKLAGATNVEVLHENFLNLNPEDQSYSKVRAILLDPSCSGSGTVADRLDYLLPSHTSGGDESRLVKLAAFQKKALIHALSFPSVERVVYSTCSVHQIENEDVVKSVLPVAASYGFQLSTPFPQWARRGLPVVEGSQHLLRTDPVEDKEGFFIALFTRNATHIPETFQKVEQDIDLNNLKHEAVKRQHRQKKFVRSLPFTRLSRLYLHRNSMICRR